MSEQNKKEFQTPYEEYRVKAGYTRESASEELKESSLSVNWKHRQDLKKIRYHAECL